MKMVKCTGCGHVTSEKKPNDTCDRIIDSITLGRSHCNGIYILTKGQLFRDKHGYSKTLKRNMRKNGLDLENFSESFSAYKEIRKKRKKAQKAIQKAKYDAAKANRNKKALSKTKPSK